MQGQSVTPVLGFWGGPCDSSNRSGNSWVMAPGEPRYPFCSSPDRAVFTEVRTGFEPAYNGFANRMPGFLDRHESPCFLPFCSVYLKTETAATVHDGTGESRKMGNYWETRSRGFRGDFFSPIVVQRSS
jgi:hypothetical protein